MPDSRLYTPADLAEMFGISVRQLMEWRRENGWPCVKVGRTIRFTAAQVDRIVAQHTVAPEATPDQPQSRRRLPGQSDGSWARNHR